MLVLDLDDPVSPTARSLALLRANGWYCEVVEHWNPFSKTRKDLWGWCDILCLDPIGIQQAHILAVQTTTKVNMGARIKKILASKMLKIARACGVDVEVHGWYKSKGRWQVKILGVT